MQSEVVSNLEGLASIIGTFQGISDAAKDERFIQQILLKANERALNRFNAKAAVRSRRTKNLNRNFNHMYEYGVAGITPGRAVISDPTSQEARLWVFNTTISGRSINTVVTFRDAVVPNPRPEERRDLKRFPDEVIQKMSNRKYVFRKRAEMVEYGKDVEIRPTHSQMLIFPSNESTSGPHESGGGVGFWPRNAGPMRINLGGETVHGRSKHKMAFTNYFMSWWETTGEADVRVSAHNSIAARIGAASRAAAKASAALKPPSATNITAETEAAAMEAKRIMMSGDVV